MNNTHPTRGNIVTSGTPIRSANKRWSSVLGASLAVLILTAAVVAPAMAGPQDIPAPGTSFAKMNGPPVKVEKFDSKRSCHDIATEAANKVRSETGSESAAQTEYTRVKNKCLESRR